MRRRHGFCQICRPHRWRERVEGIPESKWSKYDISCAWCGGWGVIPYVWRKGDRDRRSVKDRRKS